jgi:hypothetical protein
VRWWFGTVLICAVPVINTVVLQTEAERDAWAQQYAECKAALASEQRKAVAAESARSDAETKSNRAVETIAALNKSTAENEQLHAQVDGLQTTCDR